MNRTFLPYRTCPRPAMTGAVALVLAAFCALAVPPAPALAATAVHPDQPRSRRHDPVSGIVRRMDRYLERNEVDGVTMDWRYEVSPSEEIRQTVVCQVLAYVELYRLHPRRRLRTDIVEHADFLLGRMDAIRSHTPFDGMLAYSLLAAYETTGEARFLTAGAAITDELLAIPTSECILNGGLMVALATADYARLTGNPEAEQKTRDIVAGLAPFQNEDGSFPHWCGGSRDIHYTGWMSMELIHIERMLDIPSLAPTLARMTEFLAGRIGPDGRAIYEEACPDRPVCVQYYYSRATGCGYDYDTRGWTVEPAYCALAFDHADDPAYPRLVGFLASLEHGGTFPDLYGYWPPPEDPEYPWTIADTSVVNMSVIFWALTTELTDRAQSGEAVALALDDDEEVPSATAEVASRDRLAVGPNPARGACTVSFVLDAAADVSVAVFDARGRCVRRLEEGLLRAGPHGVSWDGRDGAGRAVPGGVYFARIAHGKHAASCRFAIVR